MTPPSPLYPAGGLNRRLSGVESFMSRQQLTTTTTVATTTTTRATPAPLNVSHGAFFIDVVHYIFRSLSSRPGVLNLFCLVYPLAKDLSIIYPHLNRGPRKFTLTLTTSTALVVISKKKSSSVREVANFSRF